MVPGSRRSPGEGIGYPLQYVWASLVAELVKNPPAMWETWICYLGWEDPLEKGKATHSNFLAWRIHKAWTHKEPDMTERLSLLLIYFQKLTSAVAFISSFFPLTFLRFILFFPLLICRLLCLLIFNPPPLLL